jgi:glycerol-3-phosphate acyltransferase PlsX
MRRDTWIAVDAMGGDFAPRIVVDGVVQSLLQDGERILLVGQPRAMESELARHRGRLEEAAGRLELVPAEEVVGMDEPAAAVRAKRRSSIRLAAQLVRDGRAGAMVTAGNTGAAMIAAKVVIGTIEGVDRPALVAVFPNAKGRTVLLDVGANVDLKIPHFADFAVMGHCYAQEVLGTSSPRIGLMSIGEEDSKGTEQTREVFRALKASGLNFIGNVEGRDVFNGQVDVIVCDGFVGNVVLKSAESMGRFMTNLLREQLLHTWRNRFGALLVQPALAELRRRTDPNEYGAAPLLGIDGGCFIGHGRSNPRAIRNAIRRAREFVNADLHTKIRAKVAVLRSQEERLAAREAPAGAR